MNPPSGRPAPHLDPRDAHGGQEQESHRAAADWRRLRSAARKVVAGHAEDADDLAFLLEALDLHPGTDGRVRRAESGEGPVPGC
ncbi:hypothetical protein ACFYYR_15635 [Streptomyces sp. NPDC001922]|uniref:hypothetical protein n=1 Tax=Streptomyces sp. NPDC001922 TaxID=3364624 RepID=UPI003699A470